MRSFLLFSAFSLSLPFISPASAQWQPIVSGTTDSLTAITWVDGRFLVAGGGLTFLRSLDNGVSFSATGGYGHGYDGMPLNHISFHDSLNGYGTSSMACCSYQSTNDGGRTWQGWPENEIDELQVRMRMALNGTDQVVFKEGPVHFSIADGQLLNESAITIHASLDSVCPIPDAFNCWSNGAWYDTGSYGWTLTSNDRGASIQTGTFPYANYLYSAHRVNDTTIAYIDFGPRLRVSHDKGVSWKQRSTLPIVLGTITPAFGMYDAARGAFADMNGQLNLTADSGMTWTPVPTPTSVSLNDILFVDDMHVLAIGDAGTILTSSDGGYTWEQEESGTTERLHALATSGGATIAIGTIGTILRRFPAHAGMDLTTGLSAQPSTHLTLFPNPSSGTLNVRSPGLETTNMPLFTATDAFGRKHKLQASLGTHGSWALDITGLANGVHTLHCSQGDRTWKRPFLVVQ